jgi:stage III sporulation protein AH
MKTKSGKMWSGLWKRNAAVAAIALFVCAAVYLNWNYEQEVNAGKVLGESTMVDGVSDPLVKEESSPADGQQKVESSANGYFANARLNRQQARDSALTMLQESGEEDSAAAIQTMAGSTVTEAQIENLVIAKGYADCVAFIGEESLSLAVAAPAEGLTDMDTARIVDVVGQVADFTAEQIKIISVE